MRFVLALLAVSAAIYGIASWMHHQHYFNSFPSHLTPTLLFLGATTLIIYRYLIKSPESSFVQLYLLTLVIKLLVYCGYNVIIILRDRPNAGVNVAFFLIAYLLFTTLELIFLYRRISR